jgi:hypothetical protein
METEPGQIETGRWSDHSWVILLLISLALNIFLWIWIGTQGSTKEAEVILHYDATLGVDLVGTGARLWRLPLIGLGLLIINAVVAVFLRNREKALSLLVGSTAFGVQVILLIASLFIISANH